MPNRRSFIRTAIAALLAGRVPGNVVEAEVGSSPDTPRERYLPPEDRFPYFLSSPVSYRHVKLRDQFWAPRQKTTRETSVALITAGQDRAGGLPAFRENPKHYHADRSVVGMESIKLIEAMATIVGVEHDSDIEGLIQSWLKPLLAAQGADGYLEENFPPGLERPPHRWQPVWWSHETYATGHYIESAIALKEATGDQVMFASALRAANNLVAELLDANRSYVPGHPEIEQALMRLYAETGRREYLKLCGWFLEQRGHHESRPSFGRMRQDHIPIKDQQTIQGHAVMAAYLFNGVTHYVGATGDRAYRDATLAVWDDFVNTKMFLHGGGGNVSAKNEGYRQDPYCILPEDSYSESCSVFANFQWAHSLCRLTADAKYLDTAERMLYNAFCASLSLDGAAAFYRNPLQVDGPTPRSQQFAKFCCPPNIVKLFNKVAGFFYSTDADGVYVNHYGASEAKIPWRSGLTLVQETKYPWDGEITVRVERGPRERFALRLRVPQWAASYSLCVNDQRQQVSAVKGWVTVRRRWRTGDHVKLTLEMPVVRVTLPAQFREYENRAALQRGPIVYCLEEQDLEAGTAVEASTVPPQQPRVAELYIPEDATFEIEHRADLLGGVTVLTGQLRQLHWDDDRENSVRATFVPYGVWNNRSPGPMRVWLGARKAPLIELLLPEQKIGASCVS
jgi:DUF1680 family protein